MNRNMHKNSLLAYSAILPTLKGRRKVIVEWLVDHDGFAFTDRQIKDALGFADMNNVRPRITDLCCDGILEEVDQVCCPITERLVRRVKLAEGK